MPSQVILLERVNHSQSITQVFERLLENGSLVDCTIAAEGQYLKAHRVILSACSPYFELLFSQDHEKNPIVILKDTTFEDLKAVIDFVYRGYIKIPVSRRRSFVTTLESLQIRGMGMPNEKDNVENKEMELLPVHEIGFVASADDHEHAKNPSLCSDASALQVPRSCAEKECPFSVSEESEPITSSFLSEQSCCDIVKTEPEDSPEMWLEASCSPVDTKEVVNEETMLSAAVSEACDSFDRPPPETRIEIVSSKGDFSCDAPDSPDASQLPTPVAFEQSVVDALDEEKSTTIFQSCSERFYEPKDQAVMLVNRPENPVEIANHRSDGAHRSHDRHSAQRIIPGAHPPLAGVGSEAPRRRHKRHRCPHCEKTFLQPSQLKVHLRSHTGERPYRCSQCPKAFMQTCDLKKHQRIHTGERPYRCSQCPKMFTQSNSLNDHLRTHTGERPYGCPQCSKTFGKLGTMKVHLRTHRGNQ